MNKSRLYAAAIIVFIMAIGIPMSASAQSAVGSISYLEGRVELSRGNEILPPESVYIGLDIEEFDTLETGDDGYVEIEMSAPSAGSLVKVNPGTAFYFEGTPKESSRFRTTFQLLRGSIALKVGRLTNREALEVQTDTAVMAVRGTEFAVEISPDRSVLITVPEGQVESSTDMRSIVAEPGIIALIEGSGSISSKSVDPDDIELYREYWKGLRQEALLVNARLSIQQHSRQWDQQKQRLESAMAELSSHDAIFRAWIGAVRGEEDTPSIGEAIRSKRALSPGMIELRATLPLAERNFEALVGLEEAWRAGYAEGNFTVGQYPNAAAFYRSFQRDKDQMHRMLSLARRMIRVYRFIERASGPSFDSGGPDLLGTTPSL